MPTSLIDAMAAAGLAPAKELSLVGDGKLNRYRVDGDKAGSKNGWVVFYSHPTPAGAFGSWKTGESHTWHEVSNRQVTQTASDRTAVSGRRDFQKFHVRPSFAVTAADGRIP